jgi:hypothetical protein
MPSVARQNSIFAPVTALVFAAHQFDDLRAYLARRSEHTDTILISDVEQLLMSSDGRLAESGYRFNILGFQSLAGGVSRGLASLFSELAGQYYKPQSCDVEYSLPAAISVYNTSVRARIGALRERSLLVNHQERVVEGFLGLSHRRLDNSIFLDIVSNEIREKQPKAEFYRAELVGRELRIYYIDPATRRKDIYSDARHTSVALEKPAGSSRMNHVGADIVGRTGLLVGRAAAREIDMTAVLAQLAKLQLVPLEFVDDPEKFDQVALKWLIFLARVGIRRDDAKMIVRNAAMVGADCEARDPVDVYTRSVLGSRTAYDLLCSLLRYSKNAPITDRTALQQAAMRLILPQPSVRRQQRKKL